MGTRDVRERPAADLELAGRAESVQVRGYIYDSETGMDCLRSRYYNPEIGRFLNADNYIGSEVLFYSTTYSAI